MKILLLDTETSPNTAFVWGLFNENIPLARLIDTSEVLCWSAKWYGEKEIMFASVFDSTRKQLLKRIHTLLAEADVVITYNGARFDIPVLNKEFFLAGMVPPAPYKQLDLYQVVKRQFRFASNKLDHISEELGFGKKKETTFKLWVDCMNRDPNAWAIMEDYNRHDVVLLEKLYMVAMPWITNHPNHGLYKDGEMVCPTCGGIHIQKRGFARAKSLTYRRYQCQECGSWFKDTKAIDKDKKPKLGKI